MSAITKKNILVSFSIIAGSYLFMTCDEAPESQHNSTDSVNQSLTQDHRHHDSAMSTVMTDSVNDNDSIGELDPETMRSTLNVLDSIAALKKK